MIHTLSLTIGETCLDLCREGIDTVFKDGTNVWAEPQDNDAYRATAERLGYGSDTLLMCQEHEMLHTVLAVMAGKPHSPTMWHLAHPPFYQHYREEEAAVMAMQAYLRKLGVPAIDLAYRVARDF